MFCPNCGTENEKTARPCKKCGFKLRGVSAPKFKGTMLLNSDQAVQQLVQEARRRLEEGSSPDLGQPSLPQNDGQPVAWGNQVPGLRTLNGGLQPPRVASPRVGRTMMGVAPQIGGYAPPNPAADSRVAEPESNLDQTTPIPSEAVPTSSERAARLEALPSPQALGLDAVAANDGPGHWPGVAVPEPLAPLQGAAEGSADRATTDVDVAAVAQNGSPEITASPTGIADPASASDLPQRIHPLEIVLIFLTFGLYGLVVWTRRRKHAATRTPKSRG